MIMCGGRQPLSQFVAKTDNQPFKFGARSANTFAPLLQALVEASSTRPGALSCLGLA